MNIETVPEFVEKAFRKFVYTVEHEGNVGGSVVRLYADDYYNPTFCNTDGLVFCDRESVVTYLSRFDGFKPFFENHPLVCKYYNSPSGIVRNVIDTADNVLRKTIY